MNLLFLFFPFSGRMTKLSCFLSTPSFLFIEEIFFFSFAATHGDSSSPRRDDFPCRLCRKGDRGFSLLPLFLLFNRGNGRFPSGCQFQGKLLLRSSPPLPILRQGSFPPLLFFLFPSINGRRRFSAAACFFPPFSGGHVALPLPSDVERSERPARILASSLPAARWLASFFNYADGRIVRALRRLSSSSL